MRFPSWTEELLFLYMVTNINKQESEPIYRALWKRIQFQFDHKTTVQQYSKYVRESKCNFKHRKHAIVCQLPAQFTSRYLLSH